MVERPHLDSDVLGAIEKDDEDEDDNDVLMWVAPSRPCCADEKAGRYNAPGC